MTAQSIWYISKYLPTPNPQWGGARGYWLMRTLAESGRSCVAFTADPTIDWHAIDTDHVIDVDGGLPVCRVRTSAYESAKSWRRIISWGQFEFRLWRMPLRQFDRPDVVIVSSLSILSLFTGFRLTRRFGCPLVFEVRDIWPLTLTEEGGFSPRHPGVVFLAWLERRGYTKADAIIGTMPNLGAHVAAVSGRTSGVHCVPMGIPPSAEADELDAELVGPDPVPPGRFVVAHAGSIGTTNALTTLLDCASSMKDDDRVHFLIIGDGNLRAGYEVEFGALPNVTFVPKMTQAQVRAVMQRCDLLYFSTFKSRVWDYGQSLNKLIDYMLVGKPILGSYSGFPSMVNEARCGSFVAAEDPSALREEILRYQAMSTGTRDEMGSRGRAWLLANRTYDKLAAQYAQILDGCVGRRGVHRHDR